MPNKNALTSGSSVDIIRLLEDHPDFCQACSEALTDAARIAKERIGTAEITLKIKLKPVKGGTILQVQPSDPTIKIPKGEWASKPYYVTEHGQLLRDHPGQLGLFDPDAKDEPTIERNPDRQD